MTSTSWKFCSNSRRNNKHGKQDKSHDCALNYSSFAQQLMGGSNDEKNLFERLPAVIMRNDVSSTSTASVTSISTQNNMDSSVHVSYDEDFESLFDPRQMRCLALIAHNHMKPSMLNFILANRNLLKKFRLTGTNTTMMMLQEIYRDDPHVMYGPTCKSGPLGGDAQVVTMMCNGDLGGVIFFVDPMSSHPHSADIECLTRQIIVHNIYYMNNPVSANAGAYILRQALSEGRADLIPSFFKTLESPSVGEYKVAQRRVSSSSMDLLDASMRFERLQELANE